jgi:uncharacterized membrane protein YhaH (DUF805 family)
MRWTGVLRKAAVSLSSILTIYLVAQILSWSQFPARRIFVVLAAAVVPLLLLWPVYHVVERRRHEDPEVYWLFLIVAFIVSGIAVVFVL